MIRLSLISGFLFFCAFVLNAVDISFYQYHIDLNKVENDRVAVELIAPPISSKTTTFYMPKIVPGTYSVYDFGRFVSELKAFDKRGNELEVLKKDVNSWEIRDARRLNRITYLVDDSDDHPGAQQVAGMSGTNIEAGENFIINTHGFFGYFEGMKQMPFQIMVRHPEYFFGATALVDENDSPIADSFMAESYNHLVDSPMMYSRPDTAVVQVANAEVLVSVHSPQPDMNAELLAESFTPVLLAARDLLGGKLPVDRYAFLLYFRDPQKGMNNITGALEHSYSSLYYLPYFDPQFALPLLNDIAAHEFFHILTPLNVHSEEIRYFDFNDPDMSRHLWLYEGVTEYFAGYVQVHGGLISFEEYLGKLQEKLDISQSNYDDELAFTELSKECLGKHEKQYGNVYQKGALIGMALDIELRRLSDGKYGLIDLMGDLAEKYGKNQPFKDKKLFKEIAALTYPEIKDFLKTYIGSDEPLPYQRLFGQVGIRYTPPGETMGYSLGNIQLGFNPETNRLVVADVSEMDEFGKAMGYQPGDEIIEADGTAVPVERLQAFIGELKAGLKEGETLTVLVMRKGEDGKAQEVELSAPVRKVKKITDPQLAPVAEPTEAQLELRNAWLGKKV